MALGSEYDVTEDYCCGKGGVWDPCGKVEPCGSEMPAEPDAGVADALQVRTVNTRACPSPRLFRGVTSLLPSSHSGGGPPR